MNSHYLSDKGLSSRGDCLDITPIFSLIANKEMYCHQFGELAFISWEIEKGYLAKLIFPEWV